MKQQINIPIHPYARYGLAVCMFLNKVKEIAQVDSIMIADVIQLLLTRIRLITHNDPNVSQKLKYEYSDELKGNAANGQYLSPHITSSDLTIYDTYNSSIKIIQELRSGKDIYSNYALKRSFAPFVSKINKGKKSQQDPKASLLDSALSTITTLTWQKPAMWVDNNFYALISDLEVMDQFDFIELFDEMINSHITSKLFEVDIKEDKKYKRPLICYGNYPYAPRNSAFGAVGLLGAIGKWAEEANKTEWAKNVLEKIVKHPMYLISYNKIKQVQFNHHIVQLALHGNLYEYIAGLNNSKLHSEERKSWDNPNYKLFFMMASRFLQLFSKSTFKDFLAFRAEYYLRILPLIKEYFRMERIEEKIVNSAKELGAWLNYAAYIAARKESNEKEEGTFDKEKLRRIKAKALIELESSALSAREPSSLLSQVITRAGRLSGTDAPVEAEEFMKATATGKIDLDTAKDLIIAFLRLSTFSKEENKIENNFIEETEGDLN
jgi:hypothetical protein